MHCMCVSTIWLYVRVAIKRLTLILDYSDKILVLPLLQEFNSVADQLANEAVALPGTEICISMQQTVT